MLVWEHWNKFLLRKWGWNISKIFSSWEMFYHTLCRIELAHELKKTLPIWGLGQQMSLRHNFCGSSVGQAWRLPIVKYEIFIRVTINAINSRIWFGIWIWIWNLLRPTVNVTSTIIVMRPDCFIYQCSIFTKIMT